MHLIGIALTGTSVDPARSLGPAVFVGGTALEQVWLFVLAPLAGGALAALATLYSYPGEQRAPETTATTAVPASPGVDRGPDPSGRARQPATGTGMPPVQ